MPNISFPSNNNSSDSSAINNTPQLSQGDPNSVSYVQPQQANDALILGSDMSPSSQIAQDFAHDVQAPLYSAFLPVPFLNKATCPQKVRDFLGYPNPTKPNMGGFSQPFDPLAGRYLSNDANPGLLYSTFAHLSVGLAQGYTSSISGAPTPPAVSNMQKIGQFVEKMTAKIAGLFY